MANNKFDPILEAEYQRRLSEATGLSMGHWAFLETTLMLQLERLILCDQFRTRVIWSSLPNFRARWNLLQRLGEAYLFEPQLPVWRRLLNRAHRLSKTRNLLAHSCWVSRSGQVFTFSLDGEDDENGFNFGKITKLTIVNIENFPNCVHKLASEVATFNLVLQTHSLPKTHRVPQIDPNQKSDHRPPEPTPSEP
jgi:hypothetical protein